MFGKKKREEPVEAVAEAAGQPAEAEAVDNIEEQADSTLVNQITSLEDIVNQKTKELEETRGQLEELSATRQDNTANILVDNTDGVEVVLEMPNKSGGSPVPEAEVDTSAITGAAETTGDDSKAEAEDGDEDEGEGEGDDLFSMEEEEVNPLAGLMAALPDVSADELMQELVDIKDLVTHQRSGA